MNQLSMLRTSVLEAPSLLNAPLSRSWHTQDEALKLNAVAHEKSAIVFCVSDFTRSLLEKNLKINGNPINVALTEKESAAVPATELSD